MANLPGVVPLPPQPRANVGVLGAIAAEQDEYARRAIERATSAERPKRKKDRERRGMM